MGIYDYSYTTSKRISVVTLSSNKTIVLVITVIIAVQIIFGYGDKGSMNPRTLQKRVEKKHNFAVSTGPCHANCIYIDPNPNRQARVQMTTFKGYGRTGNYIRSLRKAVNLAFLCQTTIQLPPIDALLALPINDSFARLDFSQRSGETYPWCKNFPYPVTGDARFYWRMQFEFTAMSELNISIETEIEEIDNCIRKYLGICNLDFCERSEFEERNRNQNTLVAHVREGDIFKSGYSSVPARCYGQPPLSYYLRAVLHRKWDSVLLVGDKSHYGPVRSGLQNLVRLGLLREFNITFQASSWSNDIRTLLCAKNLVTSRSSLLPFWNLGFARNIYSYSCVTATRKADISFFIIPLEQYPYWWNHQGSAEEWVDMLLHYADPPSPCGSGTLSPDEPQNCLPFWTNLTI